MRIEFVIACGMQADWKKYTYILKLSFIDKLCEAQQLRLRSYAQEVTLQYLSTFLLY